MAKRKTMAKSTIDLKSQRVPIDLDGDGNPDIDISFLNHEPAEEIPEQPETGRKTLDEIIASVYKNPKPYRFIAPIITGYKLAVGSQTIAFVKSPTTKVGELITDDPWVIEQLLRHRDCNLKYYAESAELRNFK